MPTFSFISAADSFRFLPLILLAFQPDNSRHFRQKMISRQGRRHAEHSDIAGGFISAITTFIAAFSFRFSFQTPIILRHAACLLILQIDCEMISYRLARH
jgi:hypothetical protein